MNIPQTGNYICVFFIAIVLLAESGLYGQTGNSTLDVNNHKNLFIKVSANKTHCYVGEPIIATYELYSALETKTVITRLPSLQGFSVNDLVHIVSLDNKKVKINGMKFEVYTLKKSILIPLVDGKLNLDEMIVKNQFKEHTNSSAGDPASLDDLIRQTEIEESNGVKEQTLVIKNDPLTLTVHQLPQKNRPDDFIGAIGSFRVRLEWKNLNERKTKPGEIRLEIKGKGNLFFTGIPEINWPKGLRPAGMPTQERPHEINPDLQTQLTIVYPFHAEASGTFTIPPLVFSCFDPYREEYKICQTNRIVITASPTSAYIPPTKYIPRNRIVYYKPYLSNRIQENLFKSFLLFLIALLIGITGGKKSSKEKPAVKGSENAKELQNQGGDEEVNGYMEKVLALYSEENRYAFYHEMNITICKVLQETLGLTGCLFNRKEVIDLLISGGFAHSRILELENFLDLCERNLYVPDYEEQTDLKHILNEGKILISWLLKRD